MPSQPKPYKRPGKSGYYARLSIPDRDHPGRYKAVVRSLKTSDPNEARKRFPGVYAALQLAHGLREETRDDTRGEVERWLRPLEDGHVDLKEAIEEISGAEVEWDEDTRRHVESPIQKHIHRALEGKDSSLIPPTWEEAIGAWESRRERRRGVKPSQSSKETLQRVIKELKSIDAWIEPGTITAAKAWRWIRSQEQLGKAAGTIKSKAAMLKALTKACSKVGLLPSDPLADLEYEAPRGKAYRSPSKEEYKKVWSNLNALSKEDSSLLKLLILTGMRLDEGASRYGKHLQNHDGVQTLSICAIDEPTSWRPKTDASTRTITVPKEVSLISKGEETQLFEQCRYRGGKFGKTVGQRIKQILWKAADLGNDRTLSLHSFRAGFIDALRATQCPLEIEEAIVGHNNAQTTVHKRYGNGYPIEVVDEWISKASRHILSMCN